MTQALKTLAAAAAALILAGPAAAQTPPGAGGGMAGMGLPSTLDGTAAWAERLFGRLDADQDGAVTGQEMAVLSQGPIGAMGGSRLRRMIAQSDSSNDGRVSREEMVAGAERMFRRLDADGDGVLSEAERPRPPARSQPPAIPMPAAEPMPMPGMPDEDD